MPQYSKILSKIPKDNTTYPPSDSVFRALKLTPFENIKVVILGQDPYHGKGEANGLAFSVNKNIKIPPSLKNIYKELNSDLGIKIPNHGDLSNWAKQGVLLLNSILTVEANKPASHRGIGWEEYTDEIIKKINDKKKNIVFILWGKYAQEKGKYINENKHLVIRSPHPSPFSARTGFFGSKPFSKCNMYLKENKIEEIDWEL
ncbi:TPA: uracil-DNA glycosylase [Patescibacteria group bacterium]|nr:uracil-DNA glycosylase [Patescibacteria group bacterium]